jgi:hypothetical protein
MSRRYSVYEDKYYRMVDDIDILWWFVTKYLLKIQKSTFFEQIGNDPDWRAKMTIALMKIKAEDKTMKRAKIDTKEKIHSKWTELISSCFKNKNSRINVKSPEFQVLYQ